ncbi:MAG TPA: dienelactone hydrolase family protein [Casimicrobiaceae bacterium]|nr:dienelactone hydrolase family protein [Casimicrobiaceae bacterium]
MKGSQVAGNRTSENLTLIASDTQELSAYRVDPEGTPRGAIVVIQEIFGVNSHIKSVCDGFARDGYVAIAPALFDRQERNIELGYSEADIARGRELKATADATNALRDIDAARRRVRDCGRVGVVGYCWGGYLSWLAAARLERFSAAVVYYGGGIGEVLDESPRCPVLGHFGARDHAIPLSAVEEWRRRYPDHPVHVYDAGHGFNCDQRASFDAASAALARERTLEFFRQHVG